MANSNSSIYYKPITSADYINLIKKEPDTIYCCADTGNIYINNHKVCTTVDTTYNHYEEPKKIVRTKCQCCNAPLDMSKVDDDGNVRCIWCRAYNYVYDR